MNKLAAILFFVAVTANAADLTYLPAPTPISPADQATITTMQGMPGQQGVVVVGFAASAIDSTSLNMVIEGTSYTFTGSKTNVADLPNIDIWRGSYGYGASAWKALLIRNNGVVVGHVYVGAQRYNIIQIDTWLGVVTKVNPTDILDGNN